MTKLLALFVIVTGLASAAEPPDKVELTGLRIQGGEHKYVEAEGVVSLTNGILEFISVEPGGRDYESLFTVKAKPSALQFALLLIGCEPGKDPEKGMPDTHVPQYDKGSRVSIEVEWQADGKPQRAPVERFLRDRKTGKSPEKLEWVFSGSYFTKDFEGRPLFLADAEEAHISLWWNTAIPINLVGDHGNPYRGDDQGFEVNPATYLPQGTPVKLIFRKAQPK